MRWDAEVIVVGAGPAGATAARALALGGARVLVLDRAAFPRNKPCGGGLTGRALRRFPHLAQALCRIPTHEVSRLRLEGPGGTLATLASDGAAAVLVRRLDFDALLVALAREADAEVAEGVQVTDAAILSDHVQLVTQDQRVFRAPIVIGADGVHGVIARRLGFHHGWGPTAMGIDLMEETPLERLRATDPNMLWVSYGHGGAPGYAYIFPKRDHVNVGIGFLVSHFKSRASEPARLVQQHLVAELCRRGLLVGASSPEHFTPALVPLGGPLPATARGRVLLAGDAGGFVNAYTGEGLYYGMVSGELAARAILRSSGNGRRGVAGDSPARRYERAWRREIGAELRDAVLIQKYLFADARRVAAVVTRAVTMPSLADTIIRYATGRLSYVSARRRVLARFPRVLLRLAGIAFRG